MYVKEYSGSQLHDDMTFITNDIERVVLVCQKFVLAVVLSSTRWKFR